ncbi:MAG: AAA family ATPase [Candidatus Taylorbacteria bacterium]|nr:AAA family ATPase [Candidatus Taylorbacteria bacterium]
MTQDEALAILKTGANVFLTGEPGSGKTHTVNRYVAWLRERGIEPSITASTGIAATHIGGFTVHSWSGIGVKRFLDRYELDRIGSNKRVYKRVSGARILIIDEVSMLSDRTVEMVDAVCREIRRRSEPFGGLQVVLVGDFFQLPPVNKRETNEGSDQAQASFIKESGASLRFAFTSPVWRKAKPLVCYLSEQHRQEDAAFLDFLSAVRRGTVIEKHRALLRPRYSKTAKNGMTELYSHNADVDHINTAALAKLPGRPSVFVMTGVGPEPLVLSLKRGCLSPETLSLKVGARVMFTKNDTITRQFANGTLGTVTGFAKEGGLPAASAQVGAPIVRTNAGRTVFAEPMEWRLEDGGRVLARITQVPLRLAWAITVHKSQGMSLDAAHMNLADAFEYGQGYVALSRVRTLAGLSLAGLNARALEVHPEIRAKDGEFRAAAAAARERFRAMPPEELAAFHKNFIKACGGSLEPVVSGGRPRPATAKKLSTQEVTRALLPRGLSLSDMARERNITAGSIIAHLESLAKKGNVDPFRDCAHLLPEAGRFEKIKRAFEIADKKDGTKLLAPVRALLGDDFSYNELRLARLFLHK